MTLLAVVAENPWLTLGGLGIVGFFCYMLLDARLKKDGSKLDDIERTVEALRRDHYKFGWREVKGVTHQAMQAMATAARMRAAAKQVVGEAKEAAEKGLPPEEIAPLLRQNLRKVEMDEAEVEALAALRHALEEVREAIEKSTGYRSDETGR